MNTSLPFSIAELKRYSRQIYLPEIGYEGQLKLKSSSVLIIGLGGLGSPAAIYLAAAGVGHLVLVDYDVVEISNLQRQVIHSEKNIGIKKVDSANSFINNLNNNVKTTVYSKKITKNQLQTTIRKASVVLDCSDNFATRYTINQLCIAEQKPLVSAAIVAFSGQLCTFRFDKKSSPCYNCLFPFDRNHKEENCSQIGVLSASAGVIGTMQATESIKLLMGLSALDNQLMLIDTLSWKQHIVQLSKDFNCNICQN